MNNIFSRKNTKGQALIVSYIIIAALLVISSALLIKAISEHNITQRDKLKTEVFYLAEGAMEYGINWFATSIANFQISPTAALIDYPVPAPTYAMFNGATVTLTLTQLEASDRLITEGQTNVYVRKYEIIATVGHPRNNNIQATIHTIIARRLIPTFQHAVFYNDDLEILPGKNMTISGRIHTNENLYADADGSSTVLKIDSSYFRSAGNIYNHRKDSSAELAGEVSILKLGSSQYANMNGLDSDSSNWATEAITRWNGTVQSAIHGVTKLSAPAVGSIQPGGYYASNANIVITDNNIYKNGVLLYEGQDYPMGTITPSSSFYNNREGKYIKMSDIDLGKLAGQVPAGDPPCPTCTNNLPANGLLYVTRTDALANQEPGIRLINGEEILNPSSTNGLTVVSNDPVYVQGNFNTQNEKSASIIADSLNILSEGWDDDYDSTLALSSRRADLTTINCAFIAGVKDTVTGNYNGGLENYPRLHEDWSGVDLNIKGSFVELWNSAMATGNWVYGSPQYTAPDRKWNYNTNFNNTANLPPFTPWAVEARRIAWWSD